ncbi:Deoxyguanosinetriphosphate triphosphohydrolase [Candidatus Hepatincolaceae symbiont of Richtersius coronifer]
MSTAIWQKLLCKKRYNSNTTDTSDLSRSVYLVDVDRIIYSSYFRKLQDKTQVHPLSKSDYVRTRLTHSLEVAGVGRSLGYGIGMELVKKYDLKEVTEHDFGYIMQAACLAHDIGNPPFGHLGEEAIQTFFNAHKTELLQQLTEEEFNNLSHFDGNSQGFRIVTQLAGWGDEGGLKLTYATLGTFLKYPRGFLFKEDLQNIYTKHQVDQIIGSSKVGIFKKEIRVFEEIASDLGLIRLADNKPIFSRHPLAFLTEAADDICYCVADLEDAFFVGISSLKEVENLLGPIARNPNTLTNIGEKKYLGNAKERTSLLRQEPFYKKMDSRRKIEWLRGKAISNLILEAKEVFLKNEELIINGQFNLELLSLTPFAEEIQKCKEYARSHIFNSLDKINSEIKGLSAIEGILEELYKVILNPLHPKSKRINNILEIKIDPRNSLYDNLVLIMDFVADFTDRNLLEFYNTLRGS